MRVWVWDRYGVCGDEEREEEEGENEIVGEHHGSLPTRGFVGIRNSSSIFTKAENSSCFFTSA